MMVIQITGKHATTEKKKTERGKEKKQATDVIRSGAGPGPTDVITTRQATGVIGETNIAAT